MTSSQRSRRGAPPLVRERLGAISALRTEGIPVMSPQEHEPRDDARYRDDPEGGDQAPTAARDPEQDAQDILARLRDGALTAASTAYTAAHGHPLEHPDPLDQTPRRRWALTVRGAVAVAATLFVVAAVVVLRAWTASPEVVPLGGALDHPADPFSDDEARVVVHVVGEVATPGVVELAPGARVAEAIDAAGGPTPDAVLSAVNLARVVADGEQVVIPTSAADASVAAHASSAPSDGRVDINTADAATLETLPGVGPVLAGRILDWRAAHGRFTAVEELTEVSGIGPSLLARLSDLVRV